MKVSGSPRLEKSVPAHSSSPEVGSSGYDETGGVAIRSSVELKWCPEWSAYALSKVLVKEAMVAAALLSLKGS